MTLPRLKRLPHLPAAAKKKKTPARRLGMLAGALLVLAALLAGFNVCTDPFGVFGDPFMGWWGYTITQAPGVGKIAYLERHEGAYDAYILGTTPSAYPVEALNRYSGASFYDLTGCAGDMAGVEKICRYLTERGGVKHLVVDLPIACAAGGEEKAQEMHHLVEGDAPLGFYAQYLFAGPQHGLRKLRRYIRGDYLPQGYRAYDGATGSYDRSLRDVEPIGDLEEYTGRDAYAGFWGAPAAQPKELAGLDACMESLAAIKAMCQEAGAKLTVICPPQFCRQLEAYTPEEQARFRRELAQVTDYWDFTLGPLSRDPRFFYDAGHFRGCLGEMVLAEIAGDGSVYRPRRLGEHIALGAEPGAYGAEEADPSTYTARIPVLMYHHLAEEGKGNDIMSVERFTQHMAALRDGGYTAVTFQQLEDYVLGEAALPKRPVVITFDDGYASNLELGLPVMEAYGMRATIFAIGVSMGKTQYKDTGREMFPHFSVEEGRKAAETGVVCVQSHGYDLHQVPGLDPDPVRKGILRRQGESEKAYTGFLREDCQTMSETLGYQPGVLAYPYGHCDMLAEKLLEEAGIGVTLTIEEKANVLVKGMPQSLRQLGRFYMKESVTAEELLAMLEG
ncbi:polysaccharide deacetylase family protein [Acutalibacter caecimuris]|uniref:polysaccharide deacetylase family protein n=1 Tax=Acutalibacter caecimuris TaxID=3093657 RepID=UPI002AC967B2|nr:polysaccharide deacetylase family protein [Acutalibacter sp. M00118]